MTEHYKRDVVNSRHMVLSDKPNNIKNLYYFDFDCEKWRQVEPLDNLPYGLCSYHFLDEQDNNKCVVTCGDSYRLKINDPSEWTNNDTATMWEEQKWRNEIVKKGAEFDYRDKNKGYRAKVCWTKSDIIPGVVVGGRRESPNINGFGYIYKESNRIGKSGTFFDKISYQKLEEERIQNEIAKEQSKQEEIKMQEIKKTIYRYTTKTYKTIKFYDNYEYYKTLRKFSEPITLNLLLKYYKDNPKDYPNIKWDDINNSSDIKLLFIGLVSIAKDYDLAYYTTKAQIQKEYIHTQGVTYSGNGLEQAKKNFKPHYRFPNNGDIIFDIHVHNATYARLLNGDADPFDFIKSKDTFTLPDITIDNPLFIAISGSSFIIHTDGDIVTWNNGFIQIIPRRRMSRFGNAWTVNHIQGKILLNGHMWAPSMSFPVEDLVIIPKNKNEEWERNDCYTNHEDDPLS